MSRSTKKSTWRLGPALVVFALVISGPLTCGGIHDDELRCEEAAAHLQGCCPGFQPANVDCQRYGACGTTSGSLQLGPDLSGCLLARSCADLNQGSAGQPSTCERVRAWAADMAAGSNMLCP